MLLAINYESDTDLKLKNVGTMLLKNLDIVKKSTAPK